jgi:rubredoxin
MMTGCLKGFSIQRLRGLSETAVDPAKLEKARSTYYEMMGWNENGVPTKTKLEELDIAWVAQMLGSSARFSEKRCWYVTAKSMVNF